MDAPADESDRREHARQPIELKVEYRRLNTFFADYTRNICKGGTFIKTRKPLPVGTEFAFKLMVPGIAEAIHIRGVVQWVHDERAPAEPPPANDGGGEGPGMGIRFLYQDDSERQTIERLVEKMMVDHLGQLLTSKLMARAGGKPPGSSTPPVQGV